MAHEAIENNVYSLIEAGDIFLRELDCKTAITCYVKALDYPLDVNALRRVYTNLGVAYKREGLFEKAIATFERGIALDDSYVPFYSNLSSVLRLQKQYAKSAQMLWKTISITHKLNDYITLVELLKLLKKPEEALRVSNEIVKKFPNEYESYLNLGNLFASWRLFPKAVEPYSRAIRLAPDKTQAYNNIGVVYKELGRNEEALCAYQKALELNPNDSAALNNLGNLRRNMGDTQGAIDYLKRSITLNPNYADAYSNLGAVYKENKEFDCAIFYYQKALALNPEHTNAKFDIALMDLSNGHYENGWSGYEYRLKMNELLAKTHVYTSPLWQGESLHNKTIILQTEQGFGDNIMFIRYAPYFNELGAKVIVRTRIELVALFRSIQEVDEIMCEEDPLPAHDFYLPLLSCPQRFKTLLHSIPRKFPYLGSPEKSQFSFDQKSLHVGITWSGSPTNRGHKDRYIGLKILSQLFDVDHITWYSLQIGEDSHEIQSLHLHDTIIDKTELLTDFAQTAAFIQALDLVISVDTSVAHLSGALNKKTFVLLSKPAEWRWMQEGETTPWYESLVLFRQEIRGDWQKPILQIKEKLQGLTNAYTSDQSVP